MEPRDSKLFTDSTLNEKSVRFSLRNFALCPDLQEQLRDTAVKHLLARLVKLLMVTNQRRFIHARNRLNIPFGMFGLKLADFYERREQETLYLDVLSVVCKRILEEARVCIVLDDLQDFIKSLSQGYQCNNMENVLKEIADSEKLLDIRAFIKTEYHRNIARYFIVKTRVNRFSVRQRKAIANIDEQINQLQKLLLDTELTKIPIEYRYQLSFYSQRGDQEEYKHTQVEERLLAARDNLQHKTINENEVSDCIRYRQYAEISMLNNKIREYHSKYERDYEHYDGENSYLRNSIEMMKNHYEDSLKRLDFFAVEKVKLLEWEKEYEAKLMEERRSKVLELMRELAQQRRDRKKQKQKSKKKK